MAAKPEGWEFWQDVMSREVGMGVATLRKYLFELRDAGWLEIGKQKNERGFGAIQYTLKAIPSYNFCDTQNLRHAENASRENSDTQNLSHLNNTETLKDIDTLKKKKSVGSPAPLILPFSSDRFRETWEALCEEKEWAKKSRNALQIALKKLGRYDEAFAIELMEKAIEKGWKGVVFDDTDAKYQEWKSARQLAIDNQMPRTAQATKPKPPQKDSLIDAMYERMRKQREEEERQMREQIEQFKAQSSDRHGNANTPSDGHDDR
jgi:hypothetical protein